MDRIAMELALRDAGVGGDAAIGLAAELTDVWAAGDAEEDEVAFDFAGQLADIWTPHGSAGERSRRFVVVAADADVAGCLGDMCGRRVA
jgi:hypothetical protein